MNFNRLMHTPVTDAMTGKRVGRLTDIILSEKGKTLIGIVVTNDSLFYNKRFYPWKDVLSVSVFGISVRGLGERYFKTESWERNVSFRADVCGKPVHRGREELGIMRDAELDIKEAKLMSFEISKGLTEDILHGRDSVSLHQGFTAGKSELCVSDSETVKKKRASSRKTK